MRWKLFFLLLTILVIGALTFLFITGSEDFDKQNLYQKEYTFLSQVDTLSATLYMPQKGLTKQTPIVILIHGDGPQNRTSNSGYLPFIHYLVEQDIAVFTWDKKGVDFSTGNWLEQSIEDRAIEAKDAYNFLLKEVSLSQNNIGYLGFSQAGWVIPKAARLTNPSFSIIIGAAVNWLDQGAYYTSIRLEKEGIPKIKIPAIVDSIQSSDIALFTSITDDNIKRSGLDKDRFLFIARNLYSDASLDLSQMQGPLLALWGEEDLNVPANQNAKLYRKLTHNRAYSSAIKVYPVSTHGLLKAPYFNYQLESQWPTWVKALFITMGRKAYTEDALIDIVAFINENTIP